MTVSSFLKSHLLIYLILKQHNTVLLGLHVVLAVTECRLEIINNWCLDFIWVTSRESSSVSPWWKETERILPCEVTEGFSSQLSYKLVTSTIFQVTLKTVQTHMLFANGVTPSSPFLLKHCLFLFQWWWL